MEGSLILIGAGASFAAGLLTGVSALPVLIVRRISESLQDAMLGFAAGVMMAASVFSLILPALDEARVDLANETAATLVVIAGILMGGAVLWLINERVPHEHFILGYEGPPTERLRRIWLFVIAITLHNFPEGLAVGVGFGSGDFGSATALAIGIGPQNIPEGLAVAVALLTLDYSKAQALAVATATGMVEPVGGLIGVVAVTVAEALLPWAGVRRRRDDLRDQRRDHSRDPSPRSSEPGDLRLDDRLRADDVPRRRAGLIADRNPASTRSLAIVRSVARRWLVSAQG